MKIIINEFGTKISLKEDTLCITNKNKKETIPLYCISEIVISNACLLSSDLIYKCINNNIYLSFIDKYGNPYLFIENLNNACSPILKRKQLLLNKNELGVKIVKNIIIQKLKNRQLHLNEIAKNRNNEIKKDIKLCIENIQEYIKLLESLKGDKVLDIRALIQSYEGNAGKLYFKQISNLLKSKYKFEGRSFNPSKDFYNCMLNYSYGVMYGKINEYCIGARLDPYIGIMHADIYNKPTLTYDLIEPYRYYCEKTVFKLFSKSMVKDNMFSVISNGYYLNEEGKKLLLTEFYKTLNNKVKVNRKNITVSNRIKNEIILLAKVIGDSDIC